MQDVEEYYDNNPSSIPQKFEGLIQQIRQEYCYRCPANKCYQCERAEVIKELRKLGKLFE